MRLRLLRLVRLFRSRSIKTRVVRIVLVPCLAVLLIGIALSSYLVHTGAQSVANSEQRTAGLPDIGAYVVELQAERALTLAAIAVPVQPRAELVSQRVRVDAALPKVLLYLRGLAEQHPELSGILGYAENGEVALRLIRDRVDANNVSALAVYEFYNEQIDRVVIALQWLAKTAADGEVTFDHLMTADLMAFHDSVARGHALASYALLSKATNIRPHLHATYARYHETSSSIAENLTPSGRAGFLKLLSSPDWNELLLGDRAVDHGEPFSARRWDAAADSVLQTLRQLWLLQADESVRKAEDSADELFLWSVIAGVGVVLVALLAAFGAYRATTRLVRKLTDLRDRTLRSADTELPALVAKAKRGEAVDPEKELPQPEIEGEPDEIDEVAQAFGKAQQTAVTAALDESSIRHGARTVFLKIARRSQVLVHRQLAELDQIERSEANPAQIRRLFRLDHLATRTRRNAENLIILGGGRVGRMSRRPVLLQDVIGSAVAETEHYTRVQIPKTPNTAVDGSVVADVGHLLAELVDNGTSFSPPETTVEVRAGMAAKGAVVEVVDQGLGMKPEQFARFNAMLADPPDFDVMSLVEDQNIGLFVVARLADKHGVKVSLHESPYGGVRAVVVLPSALLATPPPVEATLEPGWPTNEPEQAVAQDLAASSVPGSSVPASSVPANQVATMSRTKLGALQRGVRRARAEQGNATEQAEKGQGR